MIYRVTVETTHSLQPGRETCWQRDVMYCGESLTDARIVFLREEARDYGGSYGNRSRQTVIEQFEGEPDNIDSTEAAEVETEDA